MFEFPKHCPVCSQSMLVKMAYAGGSTMQCVDELIWGSFVTSHFYFWIPQTMNSIVVGTDINSVVYVSECLEFVYHPTKGKIIINAAGPVRLLEIDISFNSIDKFLQWCEIQKKAIIFQ